MSCKFSNVMSKVLLLLNMVLMGLAVENFQLEASFDGNDCNPLATVPALSSLDKENVPITAFLDYQLNDPSVFQTQLPHVKPDIFTKIGDKIDSFADALLHGNLGQVALSQNPKGDILDEIANVICELLDKSGKCCCPKPQPSSSSPGGGTTQPHVTSQGTSGTSARYYTTSPSVIETLQPKDRSLIKPSQVTHFIVPGTSAVQLSD